MSRESISQVWMWGALVSLAIAVSGVSQAVGQETETPGNSTETAASPAKTAAPQKQFRGRLPAYYRTVVDQKQREAIYVIQKEYWTQIEALKAQLAALTEQRNKKVAAVLTPEQLKQVEATATAAKAKRETDTTQK